MRGHRERSGSLFSYVPPEQLLLALLLQAWASHA
jgi:hypothetical protein